MQPLLVCVLHPKNSEPPPLHAEQAGVHTGGLPLHNMGYHHGHLLLL